MRPKHRPSVRQSKNIYNGIAIVAKENPPAASTQN
jgi:hypothetical protein